MNLDKLKRLVLISSFRRSGTHLTIDSIINNVSVVSPRLFTLDQLSHHHKSNLSIKRFSKKLVNQLERYNYVIIKTHQPDQVYPLSKESQHFYDKILHNAKKIYVIRDGRDVMVSLWHYLSTIDPNENSTFNEHLLKHLPAWQDHVNYWNKRRVYSVKFEDWYRDYEKTLSDLLTFIELQTPEKINNMVRVFKSDPRYNDRIPNLVKRLMRKTKWNSKWLTAIEPREGLVGSWKIYFSEENKSVFKNKCGIYLEDLGYEKDSTW